jgi:CBS domain-containing protein
MTIARLIDDRNGQVWAIHAADTVADAIEVLTAHKIGALPVLDGNGPVAGVFPNVT